MDMGIQEEQPRRDGDLLVALAQVDTCVGDLDGNADIIMDYSRKAAEQGATLVVFPEMSLTGDRKSVV